MHIRKADPADEAAINVLMVESYSEYAERIGQANWNEMRARLESAVAAARLDTFFVAEIEGRPAGAISYAPPQRGTTPRIPADWASIRFLGVARSARGAGVGRALTERCVAAARADGAEHIGLFTSEAMLAAQKIYASLGFEREAEIDAHFGLRYWLYRLDL